MSKIKTEIRCIGGGAVLHDEAVLFDTPSAFSAVMPYDLRSGEITFDEPGLYSVKWWVATETAPHFAMEFALEISSESGIEYIKGCSPKKTGQISGFGIVDVKSPGTKLSLKNVKVSKTVLSLKTEVKAYLLVTRINTEYPSGLIGVYHANLAAVGSFREVVVGKVVYKAQHNPAGTFRIYVKSTGGTVTVDIKRSSQIDSYYSARTLDNYGLTETEQNIDTAIYSASNEMNRTWIRQQDPETKLWSMHEIDLFASAGRARVTIFVYLIYENIDLSGLEQ